MEHTGRYGIALLAVKCWLGPLPVGLCLRRRSPRWSFLQQDTLVVVHMAALGRVYSLTQRSAEQTGTVAMDTNKSMLLLCCWPRITRSCLDLAHAGGRPS